MRKRRRRRTSQPGCCAERPHRNRRPAAHGAAILSAARPIAGTWRARPRSPWPSPGRCAGTARPMTAARRSRRRSGRARPPGPAAGPRRTRAVRRTGRRAGRPRSCGTDWPDSGCPPCRTRACVSSPETPHKTPRSSGRRCRSAVAGPLPLRPVSAPARRRPRSPPPAPRFQAGAWTASWSAAHAAWAPAIRPNAVPIDMPTPAV